MEKIYRPNVAAVILSHTYPFKCEIFMGLRKDLKVNKNLDVWQFPQGGIDEGENPKEALFRELKEEIGTNDIAILDEHPEWFSYDFPEGSAKLFKPYCGQKQKYFLVRLNNTARIDLEKAKDDEFVEYKFVDVKDVISNISSLKREISVKVLGYFRQRGFF